MFCMPPSVRFQCRCSPVWRERLRSGGSRRMRWWLQQRETHVSASFSLLFSMKGILCSSVSSTLFFCSWPALFWSLYCAQSALWPAWLFPSALTQHWKLSAAAQRWTLQHTSGTEMKERTNECRNQSVNQHVVLITNKHCINTLISMLVYMNSTAKERAPDKNEHKLCFKYS